MHLPGPCLTQIPQPTCQFTAGGLNKKLLTGSGCVALGIRPYAVEVRPPALAPRER
jgi:hypothetical protein